MGAGLGDHGAPPNVPIPDIDPPGRVQTVEIEVEPEVNAETPVSPDKDHTQEQQQEPKPPTPPPESQPQPPSATAADTQSPPVSEGAPNLGPQPQPLHPPPFSKEMPEQFISASSSLPKPSILIDDRKKKGSKPKSLPSRRLLPLHQDVAHSTKRLVEPSTPDFKPTPEWVRPPPQFFFSACNCDGSLGIWQGRVATEGILKRERFGKCCCS